MIYSNKSLDRKHYIAKAWLRFRLNYSPRCSAARIDSLARLRRVVDQEAA